MIYSPVFGIPSCSWKQGPTRRVSRTHLMLAGISQTIFLKEWGDPDTRIGLDCLGSLCNLGSLFLIAEPSEETHKSVWIYKKKDRILFFTEKRLTSHFKWSEFREKCKKVKQEGRGGTAEKSRLFIPLALVA